jgi:hypothetical protein
MKPLFTVHAGEYLVGSYIEQHFKKFNVWIPSKDTGIDLLVTNSENNNGVSLQVKFSKDFPIKDYIKEKMVARGWWTLNRDKIMMSKADLWVFVLYSFSKQNEYYVIIKPDELLGKLEKLPRKNSIIHSYFSVTSGNKCWETRGLRKKDQIAITQDKYVNKDRDFTKYLNNWEPLKNRLIN